MAKRSKEPPAQQPDVVDEGLMIAAEMLLADYFFDPDNESVYKTLLSMHRPIAATGAALAQETFELTGGDCDIQIDALRTRTHFRISISHPEVAATVEGVWSFDKQELSQPRVVARTGDPDKFENLLDELIDTLEESDLDGAEFGNLMASITADDEDEDTVLIGDDPTEPPEATELDRTRVKAVAKRLAGNLDTNFDPEDHAWLEQMPQTLPVITEQLLEAARASPPDQKRVEAYHQMLSMQLQFVRYRQDRGWAWADKMLDAFQRRLIALGVDQAAPRDDWFLMASAMTQARVPVSDAVQTALAEAGFIPRDVVPPEELLHTLRGFMDDLSGMVSSPFDAIHTLKSSGAMMPAKVREFMATELALSPQEILREAVPLMMLDDDRGVRRSAAAAMTQSARPETMTSDSLRRAITLRNWIPQADRSALDGAIRTARLAGVEIGAWPAAQPELEFHASTIDGTGAQSILIVGRKGKKALFAGILLRYGTGVVDAWLDQELARGKVSKLLREARMSSPFTRVDKNFVDQMVQHAIGTSTENDAMPPALLLEIAELIGGNDWRDRRLDIKAEAERMFQALPPSDRSPDGVEAGFARGLTWMPDDDVFSSWYEDGPRVQQTLAKLSRTDQVGMIALTLTDILPPVRWEWTERFLLMALWYQAAADAKTQSRARDLVPVAQALAGDGPIGDIPFMVVLAIHTVKANLLGAW